MTAEVGIGLVGAGWMGSLHTTAYRRVRDHYSECRAMPRFVIVADQDERRARDAADRLGYMEATVDIDEVVAHPQVDAISITAPNYVHRSVALKAAAAGKHFWGEKPLGRFPEETAEIAQAVEAAGIRTVVGFNYRHAPAVRHAHRLISDGRLGEIASYRGEFMVDYASDPRTALSWRFSRDLAGLGVLGDTMSHVVDMAMYLVGPIESVIADEGVAISERPRLTSASEAQFSVVESDDLGPVENDDYVSSLARFRSGTRGIFEVSRTVVGPHFAMRFHVHGTRGALAWDFQRLGELELYLPALPSGDIGYTRVWAGPEHGDFGHFQPTRGMPMGFDDLKVAEAHSFLQLVLDEGDDRPPGARQALAVAEVLDAMRRSAASGKWQHVATIRCPRPS